MNDEIKNRIERIYQTKLAKYKDDIPDDAFKLLLHEEALSEVLCSLEYNGRKANQSETNI
jgi:hypothetical protein